MPNWCNNSIRINGDEKIISALVRVIENTKNGEDRVFQSLIGYPDHMTKADYDSDWYDTNIGWFGTKWDVSYSDCNMDYDKTEIRLSPDTAWSPPIEFLTNLVKQYDGIEAYIFYSEGGIGFCGETNIYLDEDGRLVSEDAEYEYNEGMYLLANDEFWCNIECDIETAIENEEELEDFLSGYSYVSHKDKLELTRLYNETKKDYETSNEGEDIEDDIS